MREADLKELQGRSKVGMDYTQPWEKYVLKVMGICGRPRRGSE